MVAGGDGPDVLAVFLRLMSADLMTCQTVPIRAVAGSVRVFIAFSA
jgi:hypothetical protein